MPEITNSLLAVQAIVTIPFGPSVLLPVDPSAVLYKVVPEPCAIVLLPVETLKIEIISPALNTFCGTVRVAPLVASLISFPASLAANV